MSLTASPSSRLPQAPRHPQMSKAAQVYDFLTSVRYCEEAMPRITDNTPLIEVFSKASKKIFGWGGAKKMHFIPQLDDYLLGITKYHRFDKPSDFLSSLAESTALTPPNFTIPDDGLLPLSYGKAVLHILSEYASLPPLLTIHRKIQGQTLFDFYSKNPEAAKAIMATWPQETFEDVMRQGLTLEQKGHAIDASNTKNVIVSGENTGNPKFRLIDPLYGDIKSQCGTVDIFMFFNTKKYGENPPALLEKLLSASKEVGFGIPRGRESRAKEKLELGFYGDEVKQIMEHLSLIPQHDTPQSRFIYTLPPILQAILPLSLHSNLRDLRACVSQIEKADEILRNNQK